MNAWPEHISYKGEYSYTSSPYVYRTTSTTNVIRQRLIQSNRNDEISVNVIVDDTDYQSLITFAKDNPDRFTGPYFDCDVKQFGELRIKEGTFNASIDLSGRWHIGFQLEVIDRQHTIGEELYALFNVITPNELGQIAAVLEKTINYLTL